MERMKEEERADREIQQALEQAQREEADKDAALQRAREGTRSRSVPVLEKVLGAEAVAGGACADGGQSRGPLIAAPYARRGKALCVRSPCAAC